MEKYGLYHDSLGNGMPLVPLHKLFLRPSTYFYRLDQNPRWLPAFIVICLIAVSVSMLHRPYSERVMLRSLTETMGAESAAQTVELSRSLRWIGIALVPFERMIKITAVATILFYTLQIFGQERLTFKKIFAVAVCSEFIPAAVSIVDVGLLYTKDISAVATSMDLTSVPGLELFLSDPESRMFEYTALKNINFGSLWYLGVLSSGLAVVSGIRKRTVVFLTAGFWLLSIGVELMLMVITSRLVNDVLPH